MKSLHYVLFLSLILLAGSSYAQGQTSEPPEDRRASPKRGPVFRANKDQVAAAQTMLRTKGLYAGDVSGTLDAPTRDSIKSYQKDNGLRASGTLNRATLEKMGIALTDKQKAIPVPASSYASSGAKSGSAGDRPKRSIFRATKEQVIEAQKLLKNDGMYTGDETGKLDDPTREALKKYQEAKGLKATGTLNQLTLEKMGIGLTDKQKGDTGAN
jgi:peptidoglycan hydrolase-like protein with peptidoglycan-binding domain